MWSNKKKSHIYCFYKKKRNDKFVFSILYTTVCLEKEIKTKFTYLRIHNSVTNRQHSLDQFTPKEKVAFQNLHQNGSTGGRERINLWP